MSRMNHLRAERTIKRLQEGPIHKYDLINFLGISISTYEKWKPWFEHTYFGSVKYENNTKRWVWIEEKISKS